MMPPGTPADFSDSDAAWLASLRTGATGPAADPEAVLLRDALQAERVQAEGSAASDAALRESRLQQLLFEVRRQRLLAPAATPAPALPAKRRWPTWTGWALAAALALGVGIPLLQRSDPAYDELPGWRGGGPQAVRSEAQPRAAAEALAGRLRAQGLGVLIYQDGPAYVLDIEVSGGRLEAVRPLLAAEHLAPVAGIQRVRVQP